MTGRCGSITYPAGSTASNGLATVQRLALDAITRMQYAESTLRNFLGGLQDIPVEILLEDIGSLSAAFDFPDVPKKPTDKIQKPILGYTPNLDNLTEFTTSAQKPGTFTSSAPTPADNITEPDTQGTITIGAQPEVGDYSFPNAPDEPIPGLPALDPVTIPDSPQLNMPSFLGQNPGELQVGDAKPFSWTEPTYQPLVRTPVANAITSVLGGQILIPDSIWELIWNRALREANEAEQIAIEQAEETFEARGYPQPHGRFRRAVRDAQMKSYQTYQERLKEQAIQDAQIYVDNLKHALSEGIRLEDSLLRAHTAYADRVLQAAQFTATYSVQVLEVAIAVYNAKLAAFFQQAQVFKTLLEAEVLKLEKFKAELQAEKLRGDLNLQRLEAYKARLSAIETLYGIYETQVKSVIAKYDADKTRVQAFAETIRAYGMEQDAIKTEWEIFRTRLDADEKRYDIFLKQLDAHIKKYGLYRTEVETDKLVYDANREMERLKVDMFGSFIRKYEAEMGAEVSRVKQLYDAFGSEVNLTQALGQIEQSRVASDDQRYRILFDNAKTRADIAMENLRMRVSQAQASNQILLSGFNAILSAEVSVSSSSLAALNYSATLSDTISNSISCSTTYQGN